MTNIDLRTAKGFDRIWARHGAGHSGSAADSSDAYGAFAAFFSIFPLGDLAEAEGFELGSGSGRIAQFVAPRVGLLHCIDPSPAGLGVARRSMRHLDNVRFHEAAVDSIPIPDGSQDSGYSVGVLHHMPDPEAGFDDASKS